MQEKLLAEHHVKGEHGEDILLSYYLLVEELRDPSGSQLCELYGAKINRRCSGQVEAKCLRRITVLGEEMLRIVEELSRYQVFPVHLEDCVLNLLP